MKPRVAILISGRGSNMLSIAHNCAGGILKADISFVTADNPEAEGLAEAAKLGLQTHVLPYGALPRAQAEDRLDSLLSASGTNWLLLAGFMKILSPEFVSRRSGRIVNIHPSLLPSFPGVNSIKRAFEYGVSITGVTVHLVDEMVDHGRILSQEPVRIIPGETLESLEARIHSTEHILYTRTLIELLDSSRQPE